GAHRQSCSEPEAVYGKPYSSVKYFCLHGSAWQGRCGLYVPPWRQGEADRMRTAVLIAVMLAAPLGAQASDRGRGVEAMQATFGNTVVSHYPNGNWVKHWFDRDGAYRALFSDGRRLTARWAQEGDKICLNEIRPRMI